MEKFPETYNLSKLDEEAESLNRLITAGEIEAVIKKKIAMSNVQNCAAYVLFKDFYGFWSNI